MAKQQFGGSFAPPLSDDLLASYQQMTDALPAQSPIRDAMGKLLACCKLWWELPESTGNGRPHPSGRGLIIDLDKQIADSLWDAIPWGGQKLEDGTVAPDELGGYGKLFDSIDPKKDRELRNAAFHLLWHVTELHLDREPLSSDKL